MDAYHKAIEYIYQDTPDSLSNRMSSLYKEEIGPREDYGGADETMYDELIALLKAGKYLEVIDKSIIFCNKFPKSDAMVSVLDNFGACFWLGVTVPQMELHYQIPGFDNTNITDYEIFCSEHRKYYEKLDFYKKIVSQQAGFQWVFELPRCWTFITNFYWMSFDFVKTEESAKVLSTFAGFKSAGASFIASSKTNQYYQTKKPDFAKSALDIRLGIIKDDPKNVSLDWIKLEAAYNMFFLKQLKEADAMLSGFETSYPKSRAIGNAYVLKAQAQLAQGQYETAITTFSAAAKFTKYQHNHDQLGYIPMAFAGKINAQYLSKKYKEAKDTAGEFRTFKFPAPDKGFEPFYAVWKKYNQSAVEFIEAKIKVEEEKSERAAEEYLAKYKDDSASQKSLLDSPYLLTYADYGSAKIMSYKGNVKFIDRYGDDLMYAVGEMYEKQGNLEQAITWYTRLIDTYGKKQATKISSFYYTPAGMDPMFMPIGKEYYEFVDKAKDRIPTITYNKTTCFIETDYLNSPENVDKNKKSRTVNITIYSKYGINGKFIFEANPNNFEFLVTNIPGNDTELNLRKEKGFILSNSTVVQEYPVNISPGKTEVVKFQTSGFSGDKFKIHLVNTKGTIIKSLPKELQVERKYKLELDRMKKEGNGKSYFEYGYTTTGNTTTPSSNESFAQFLTNKCADAGISFELIGNNEKPTIDYKAELTAKDDVPVLGSGVAVKEQPHLYSVLTCNRITNNNQDVNGYADPYYLYNRAGIAAGYVWMRICNQSYNPVANLEQLKFVLFSENMNRLLLHELGHKSITNHFNQEQSIPVPTPFELLNNSSTHSSQDCAMIEGDIVKKGTDITATIIHCKSKGKYCSLCILRLKYKGFFELDDIPPTKKHK